MRAWGFNPLLDCPRKRRTVEEQEERDIENRQRSTKLSTPNRTPGTRRRGEGAALINNGSVTSCPVISRSTSARNSRKRASSQKNIGLRAILKNCNRAVLWLRAKTYYDAIVEAHDLIYYTGATSLSMWAEQAAGVVWITGETKRELIGKCSQGVAELLTD